MSGITSHVLDLAAGRPARGIAVTLARQDGGGAWRDVAEATTDADGRTGPLVGGAELIVASYRLRFALEAYWLADGRDSFYPHADVVFVVRDAARHYHVPLLVSPFGYSTYRGS